MSRKKFWPAVLSTFALSALVVGAGTVLCGVGYGSCGLSALFPLLFPYAVLAGALNDDPGSFILLAVVQYPLYVVTVSAVGDSFRARITATVIFVAHALAVLLAFLSWR